MKQTQITLQGTESTDRPETEKPKVDREDWLEKVMSGQILKAQAERDKRYCELEEKRMRMEDHEKERSE